MLRIRQVRSRIGKTKKQREVLRTLGLRRIGQVVERPDNAAVRGAVELVNHMVRIEGEAHAAKPAPAAAEVKPAEKAAEKKTKKKAAKKKTAKKKTSKKKAASKKSSTKKTAKKKTKKKAAKKKASGGES